MLGVLGGTFDPIHNGHLDIARYALETLSLKQVHFIPCYIPAHRRPPVAAPETRLAMVKLATENHAHFIADDREIKRQDISYMHPTLLSLQKDFPDEKIALILGYDAWEGFPQWYGFKDIIQQFHIIIINRPAYMLSHQNLIQSNPNHFHLLTQNTTAIAATELRELLHQKDRTAKALLPITVFNYIESHHLYES